MNTTAQVGLPEMKEKNTSVGFMNGHTEKHRVKCREEGRAVPQASAVEPNAIARNGNDDISVDESIPVSRFFVLNGSLNGLLMKKLTHD